jgi:hypothetical protein
MIAQKLINNLSQWDIFSFWNFDWNLIDRWVNVRSNVRYVAVRWMIADWVVYHEPIRDEEYISNSVMFGWYNDELIAKIGNKMPLDVLLQIEEVDDEAKKTYRS